MTARWEQRVQLPPNASSPSVARAVLRSALVEAGLEELTDVALLLASELCTNAVMHAGTELEFALRVDDVGLTVTVTDRGPVGLELAGAPGLPVRGGSSGGHGLKVVAALASAWGTRYDSTGHHEVWFILHSPNHRAAAATDVADAAPAGPARRLPAPAPAGWPGPKACRWLLHMPGPLAARFDVPSLVTELLWRLCEVIGADGAWASVDYGDGRGEQLLASHGAILASGCIPIEIRLDLIAPLRGLLRVSRRSPSAIELELAGLSALRIALAIEFDWLRGADRLQRSWMTYLAKTSELLAQSLDVNFTIALVPQIIVPRLGSWCAVHLADERGKIVSAAWGHADESALPALRSWLDGENADGRSAERPSTDGALRPRIEEALHGSRPVTFAAPVEGLTVGMVAHQRTVGTLTVGRPGDRSHSPQDVALICDVARRASLAIANAQLNATQVTISQAFQQALLPRALPVSEHIEFAAAYLPASAGTDVGGDFYDVLALPGDRWLVAVGDVCGKGAPAAAQTGRVRDMLRALVRSGCELEPAVRLLNEALGEPAGEQQFCTLAGAVVTNLGSSGLDVELVLAGHDQPIVLRADGSTEFIGEYGTVVGPLAEMKLFTTRHTLQRGEAMVIYTDGFTERRRDTEFFGRARLAELAATLAGVPAAAMAGALRTAVRDFSPDPPRDDMALLVVKAR